MSKSIQQALDLPVLEDLLKSSSSTGVTDDGEVTDEMIEDHDDTAELIAVLDQPLRTTDEQDALDHETSMDELHKETMQHAKDLMDLGYNVDTRSAPRIFETAATMLQLAMTAKTSKRDAQLKRNKLKLDSRKLDIMERGAKGEDAQIIEAKGMIIEDRNSFIKALRDEPTK